MTLLICQTPMCNLNKIMQIRKFPTRDACELTVLGFVTTYLNNANVMLYGVHDYVFEKFQIIQNYCTEVVLKLSHFASSMEARR